MLCTCYFGERAGPPSIKQPSQAIEADQLEGFERSRLALNARAAHLVLQ